MILDQFLRDLGSRGGSLRVEGARLIYRGPPGSLAACDREFIREHRAELIERTRRSGPIEGEPEPDWDGDLSCTVRLTEVRTSIEHLHAMRAASARAPRPGN